MTPGCPQDETDEDDGPELPDEQEVPGGDDDDDGLDDLPSTHYTDEEYERFVAENLDARGRPKGDPPVTALLLGLTALILLVYALFFR